MNGLSGQGINLQTCISLRYVYSKCKDGETGFMEKDKPLAQKALNKVSGLAGKIIREIYNQNTGSNRLKNDDCLFSLLECPASLNSAIKEFFDCAYEKHLLPEEKQFIDLRLCSYAGHKKEAEHRHFGEDVSRNITAFYELLLYRYIRMSQKLLDDTDLQFREHSLRDGGLLEKFSKYTLKDPDIWGFQFHDYFEPNESNLKGLKNHLSEMTAGLIVSVGTERSLFDLLLAPKQKCRGLVIVDLNPRVKAYNDFNLLLIKISSCPKEYVWFSRPLHLHKKEGASFEKRILKIKEKLERSDLSKDLKDYYRRNLFSFGVVYFSANRLWRNDNLKGDAPIKFAENSFELCRYDKNPEQFRKIQLYAKRGMIFSVEGSINDLTFLNKHSISVVDVSNVPDYEYINIKGIQDTTRVIWTNIFGSIKNCSTTYGSYIQANEKLNMQEQAALKYVFKKWKEAGKSPIEVWEAMKNANSKKMLQESPEKKEYEILIKFLSKPIGTFYTQSTFKFLQEQSVIQK